jgi:arylformamidase
MKVYRDYDQAELDRNYTQTAWATNSQEIIAWYATHSAALRSRLEHKAGIAYGDSEAETLDLFPAGRKDAPICVFVHGGAWKMLGKDESCFAAETFVTAGIHFVALNFALIPEVRLPEMVAQVRRGIAWVHRHAASFGGDASKLYVIGHSSGAHLVAAALTSAWPELPAGEGDIVRGAMCASGMYDLEPVLLSQRGSYLELDAHEADALSPLRHIDRLGCPVQIAYGGRESPEFQRQATSFATALEAAGKLDRLLLAPEQNHFEISVTLARPDGILARAALDMMGVAD